MYRAIKALIVSTALTGKSEACDKWSQTDGAVFSAVKPYTMFRPLYNSIFENNNTGVAAASANIYFQTSGTNPPFSDLGCPAAFSTSHDDAGNLICSANDITADDFSAAVQEISTEISALPPGVFAHGYGNYTPAGDCETMPLDIKYGFVFAASRVETNKTLELDHA